MNKLFAVSDRLFGHVYGGRFGLVAYLFTVPFAEAYFYLLVRRFVRTRQARAHATHQLHSDAAEAIRCWEMHIAGPPAALAASLRNWFVDESSSGADVRRGNVVELLTWTIYNRPACTDEQRRVVDGLLAGIEASLGALLPGHEGRLRVMAYTLEPWVVQHKPLVAYLVLELVRLVYAAYMRLLGFELHAAGRLAYYCRPAPDSLRRPRRAEPTPIVLLHGVLGVLPYALLLRTLATMHAGTLLVPLMPHCSISLRQLLGLMDEPHDAHEIVAACRTMVARHTPPGRAPQAAFLAHSLGTGYLAPIMKSTPELVAAASFVDPICFLLADGSVLHNYLYASPAVTSGFHWLQRYLVANEATQQDFFRTCWWWSQHWLHPTELPCDTSITLSGRDSVANAYSVHAHLHDQLPTPASHGAADALGSHYEANARHIPSLQPPKAAGHGRTAPRMPRVEVTMHDHWTHGWLLMHPAEQSRVVRSLQVMAAAHVKRSSGGTGPAAQHHGLAGDGAPPRSVVDGECALRVARTPPSTSACGVLGASSARGVRFKLPSYESQGDTASVGSSDEASVEG